MPTRLVCRRLPLKLPGDGSCSTTEYGTRLPAVCIDWGWPSLILRIRKNACCEEIRGYSVRRPSTNATATSTMSSSPADTPWTPMAKPSIFITERRTARLPWLGPACVLCLPGSMPMEVASAGSEPKTCEAATFVFTVYVRLPSPPTECCVHHQETDIPGLLEVRKGI